jgi:heptose-I-phosphate ethanolaminephosphotransferase
MQSNREYIFDTEFSAKLWLHRVNNAQRLSYYFEKYNGFEIDILYNPSNDSFNVSHDNISGDEELTQLFEVFKRKPDKNQAKYIWLDLKNLTAENADAALSNLNNLVIKYDIDKSNLIVESSNTFHLSKFTDKGFMTSYYFTLDENNIADSLAESIYKFDSSNVMFISSSARYYNYLLLYFPNCPKLYWDTRSVEKILLKDEKTKALLVTNRKHFYN